MAKGWKNVGKNDYDAYEGLSPKEKFNLKKKQSRKDLFDIMKIRRMPIDRPKRVTSIETEDN